MTIPSFEQAVEIAKCFIAPEWNDSGKYDLTTLTGLSASQAAKCDLRTEEGYNGYRAEYYGTEMLLNAPEKLLELAETNHFAFIALRRGVENLVELEWPLPEKLQAWLSSYRREEWTPPKRGAGQPRKDARTLKLAHAVRFLVQSGMKPSRNEDSATGETASDAVAKALHQLGMHALSYKRIKNIYFEEEFDKDAQIELSPELAEKINNT